MQKSMTAFALDRVKIGNCSYQVVITSVNRKTFDLQLILPDALAHLCQDLRMALQKLGGRGAIICKATPIEMWEDGDLVKAMGLQHEQLTQIAKKLGYCERDVTFDLLLNHLQKMQKVEMPLQIEMDLWNAIFQKWDQERSREGAAIEQELEMRALHIRALCHDFNEKLSLITPGIAEEMANLAARYTESGATGLSGAIEQHQYIAAAMTLLEKSDPAEELARLGFHIESFLKRLKGEAESGKFLELLLGECQREASTLSAKVRSSLLSAIAVEIKYEIEKMKEQVLNLV